MPSQHPEAKKLISQGIFDSIKSFREFEGRVSKLIEINTTLGGDAFEIFVEAYLTSQPKMQCAKVFVVKQLPLDITKELNLPNDGKGVDGVYKSFSEISVPYQVKFRSNRPPLSLTEVSTFLGLTERAKDRVLITNCDEIARDVKNRDYLRSIRGQDFDLLEEADFELIEAWLKEKPVKRELPKPKPYQLIALEDIKKALGTHDRATAVMACGTGKTLIALWAAEQAQVNTVLVLLPSLTLMQQTLLEWSKNNSWGNRFSFICVCSDPTVKANDEIEIDPTDIDFKVDTDPELVKEFLNQKNNKVKVVFSTYQSSKIVGEAIKGLSPFDFAVFDEAHKTTGPKGGVFAFTLDDKNIAIKKRLFLTATPRHYDIKKRDKEGEFKVISMDDESIYGPRAHSLTFGSAASQGIICNYKVIISLIDKNQVDDFALKNGITLVENDKIGTRWVASQIALQQAIEKVNASKIITFHSRVKLAKEFSSETSHGIKRYLKDFEVMHVNGEQRSNERTGLIRQFKDSPKSLITNARCLTEGVDVPAVDMVAFIDARHSKVDIAQAIGRAMRKPSGSDKQFGYIVVPLFADTSDLNNLEETIKKEGFDDVAEILNALQEQDEELVDIIKELQEAKGRGEIFNPKRLSDKVEAIGPFINIDEIGASVYAEIVSQLGVSWDFWFGLMQSYEKEFKTCTFSNANALYRGYKLTYWVDHQRKFYRLGTLSLEKIKKLETIKTWVWNVDEEEWFKKFNLVKKISNETGNSFISKRAIIDGVNIGTWQQTQRILFKNGKLLEQRQKLLESLPNWVWDKKEYEWQNTYETIKAIGFKNGILNSFDPKLGSLKFLTTWINTQRYAYKKNKISQARIDLLNQIAGWIFDVIDIEWELRYLSLINYQKQFKHLNPKRNEIFEGYKIEHWIHNHRVLYNKGLLQVEKIKKIESIDGWDWNPLESKWNEIYQKVKEFSELNKHCNIPTSITFNNQKLANWCTTQRSLYNKKELMSKRIHLLENLEGWSWDPVEDFWNIRYELVKKLLETKSMQIIRNVNFVFNDIRIGRWIGTQKQNYKNNILAEDKIQKLEALKDWTW